MIGESRFLPFMVISRLYMILGVRHNSYVRSNILIKLGRCVEEVLETRALMTTLASSLFTLYILEPILHWEFKEKFCVLHNFYNL